MRKKSDQGNVERSDPPEEGRRGYLKAVGALVAGLAVGGAAGWLAKPAERITERITETVTRTITAPITPTPTPTPTPTLTPTPTPTPKPKSTKVLVNEGCAFARKFKDLNLSEEFEKDTGIKLEFETVPDAVYVDKVFESFLLDVNIYDAMVLNSDWHMPAAIAGKYLMDLSPYIDNPDAYFEDFMPITVAHIAYHEKEPRRAGVKLEPQWPPYDPDKHRILAIPTVGDIACLFYRKDWAAEEGIEIDPLYGPFETWDDVAEVGKKVTVDAEGRPITDPAHGDIVRWGFSYYTVSDFACEFMTSTIYGWGGTLMDPDTLEPRLNSPESVEAFEFIRDLYLVHKVMPEASPSLGWFDTYTYFTTSMLFSLSNWGVVAGGVEATEVGGKVGYSALPKGPINRTASIHAGWGSAIPYNAPNPDLGWTFIDWFNSAEIQGKLVPDLPPTRESVLVDPDLPSPEYRKIFYDVLGVAYAAQILPEGNALITALSPFMLKGFTGEVPAQTAMDQANEEMRRILEEAGYYK